MKKLILLILAIVAVTMTKAQPTMIESSKDFKTEIKTQIANPAYNGPCGCINPMSADEFNQVLQDIRKKNTENQMYRFAKAVISDKCILTTQVEEIILLFMYDITRSSFLKYAGNYIYDQANYNALAMKYPMYRSSRDYGQINNYTELKENRLNLRPVNELNRNWISTGRIIEMQRDNYYRGGSPPE